MHRVWQHRSRGWRIYRSLVRGSCVRLHAGLFHGADKEMGRGRHVAGPADVHIDHLAQLVDCSEDVTGDTSNFGIRLVDGPLASGAIPL